MIRYQLGKRGSGWFPKLFGDWDAALDAFMKHLHETAEKPWHIWWPLKHRWGPDRNDQGLRNRLDDLIHHGDPGDRRIVRGEGKGDPQWMLRKLEVLDPDQEERNEIVEVALAQLGDEYTFGAQGPTEFDCSGLIRYCTGHATGIWLPHSSNMIMLDDRVRTFEDRSKVLGGDFVFCHVGRLGPGISDHCGIAKNKDTIIDASSSFDMVVQRKIDSNPIMRFGRLEL